MAGWPGPGDRDKAGERPVAAPAAGSGPDRVYDAELGRFLSADPVIQDTTNLQAWNAYSYVLNNPLSYTDPTGRLRFAPELTVAGKTAAGRRRL